MSGHPNIKLAVLRGVYEDNLGIPRSSVGTGRSLPVPEPLVPPLPLKRFGHRGRAVIVALLGLAALLGINFRLVSVDSSGPVAMQVSGEQAARPVVAGTPAGPSPVLNLLRDEVLPVGSETGQDTTVVTAERYEAMLNQLGLPMADL